MHVRGTFTLPRLNAHRVVLAAAALTTLVAAALATTIVVYSGQALPRSVRERLASAAGTSIVISGPVNNATASGYTTALGADLTAALAGSPSAFYHAYGTLGGAWWAAAAVSAGAAVIMVMPAVLAPTPGAARVRLGRQATISAVSQAGADIAVLVLAVLAGWQLRRYSAVSAGPNGSTGIDPVLTLAPALALAGGTVAALRADQSPLPAAALFRKVEPPARARRRARRPAGTSRPDPAHRRLRPGQPAPARGRRFGHGRVRRRGDSS